MSTMRFSFLFFLGINLWLSVSAQKKTLEFEHLFDGTFSQASVEQPNWMNDGTYFSAVTYNDETGFQELRKYNITDDSFEVLVSEETLLELTQKDTFNIEKTTFSPDEQWVILETDVESIWRRSYLAEVYAYHFKSKSIYRVGSSYGKIGNAALSPDGTMVGFTHENNLYVQVLDSEESIQLTFDGKENEILNGISDWVYEEEFSFTKAWFWSPDSKHIAFYRFDEREIPQFSYTVWQDLYPTQVAYKYPKAGEVNSTVRIGVISIQSRETTWMNVGEEKDQYIVRLNWTADPTVLSIRRMNRLQNKQEILLASISTGNTEIVKTETDQAWIEENDDLRFLKNGKEFIYVSEEDGFNHIYLYDINGTKKQQITRGEWDVTQVVGVNEKKKLIYYLSTENSPLERHLYQVSFSGKKKKQLTDAPGMHRISMSPDTKYYLDTFSSLSVPRRVELYSSKGKQLRVLETNEYLSYEWEQFTLPTKEWLTIPADGDRPELFGYWIKPSSFDSTRSYPVLMFVYGGPGSQQVSNQFQTDQRSMWHYYLAEQGFLVVCVDNRGTGYRGAAFKKATYKQLGLIEAEDQIATARYLQGFSFVDKDRIGIWGWSYGGYLSSLRLALGNEVFAAAIAVAPVTNWKYYDTIYTERYLQTPQLNPEGYSEGSPITHAEKIKGKYLIVHGSGDDNVHVQHTMEMMKALQEANIPFESMIYPNKNHGIYGGKTREHLFRLLTHFLKENL